MSRPPSELPGRLLTEDATAFERQVIEAALMRKPPATASARMAKALGIAVTGVATTFPAKALGAHAAAPKGSVVAGASGVSPWVSVGVLGLVIGGAVVGARAWRASHSEPAPVSLSAPAPPPLAPIVPVQLAREAAGPAARPASPVRRAQSATAAGDLRDEIGFVDAARRAMSSGDGRRALEILRRYRDKYPSGSFRPEATAVRIETLMKLDRKGEARELATRFVAENRGSLLAARVAELVGLTLDQGQ